MAFARDLVIYGLGGAASRLAAIVLVPLYTRALPVEAYGGHKDVNEAWVAGMLRLAASPTEPASPPEADRPLEPWEYGICRRCDRRWPSDEAPKDGRCPDCNVVLEYPAF